MQDEAAMPQPAYKDRSTGLVVFGVLQLLLGGLFALMVPFLIFAVVASVALSQGATEDSFATMNVKSLIVGLFFYAALAAWFITMGIGSMLARRWARALVLVTSWIWLICGIGGLAAVLFLMPGMYDAMAESGDVPREMVLAMKYGTIGFVVFSYLLIPGSLVLFYQSRHVKATCEFKDPKARWTDRCPLPVLALSILCGIWSVSMLSMSAYGWVFPFFGFIVSGLAGAAICIGGSVLFGLTAWGAYRMDIRAWWSAIVLTIAWAVSIGITFSQISLLEFYEKMDFPEQQLEMMSNYDMLQSPAIFLFSLVWFAALLGYLFYLKRFFRPPETLANL